MAADRRDVQPHLRGEIRRSERAELSGLVKDSQSCLVHRLVDSQPGQPQDHRVEGACELVLVFGTDSCLHHANIGRSRTEVNRASASCDLSVDKPERLLEVATELNARPCMTLAEITQAEAIQCLPVSYTHLRAHETRHDLVCRLLLEKKKQ